MNHGVLIFGCGGHAKVVADILKSNSVNILAFVDLYPQQTHLWGIPIWTEEQAFSSTADQAIVAIGDNDRRYRVALRIKEKNHHLTFASAIHRDTSLGSDINIGQGTVVMAGVRINASTQIGEHCILNTQCAIDHDNQIGDFSSIGPGAILGGSVSIARSSHIGLGAKINHELEIGQNTIIGSGSMVVKNVAPNKLAFGTPCIEKRSRSSGDPYL